MSKSGDRTKSASEKYRDEPVSGYPAEELLLLARIRMLQSQPFFGKIAQNMSLIENNRFPTTAVDARGRMYYNRKWINGMSLEEATFEFAHETMHLVQRCAARFPKGANHGLWNKAADWWADTMLVDAGFEPSEISKEMVGSKEQAKAKELGSIEAVYRYLLENNEEGECQACKNEQKKIQDQAGKEDAEQKQDNAKLKEKADGEDEGDGGAGGEDGDGGEDSGDADGSGGDEGEGEGHSHGSEGEPHTCGNIRQCCVGTGADLANCSDPMNEQKWTEVLISSKMHAESKGNMPAALGEQIDSLTKSTVRWQNYLKTAATKVFGRDRYTFKRPNRRTRGMGNLAVRLPRAQPDGKSAVIVIDTSASMSEDEVRQCLTEAHEIMVQCGARSLYLILHDTRVYYAGEVTKEALTTLKCSRGGTCHEEVFQLLNGETVVNHSPAGEDAPSEFKLPRDVDVQLSVLFTDLGTSFPESKPSFDVIWAVPSDGCPGMKMDVPFGMKVEMDMEAMRK